MIFRVYYCVEGFALSYFSHIQIDAHGKLSEYIIDAQAIQQ